MPSVRTVRTVRTVPVADRSRRAGRVGGAPRPGLLVVICGTGTEVGKTWCAAQLLTAARAAGLSVQARKPVQSFDPASDASRRDASLLAAASGEDEVNVCRWFYPAAMAPPMAAAVLGVASCTLTDLLDDLKWDGTPDMGLVETLGGVRSPIAEDADSAQLALALEPDVVVLVADAGLGTINAVRMSIDALDGLRCVVMLNRFDPDDVLHLANRAWLRDRCGFDVVTETEAMLAAIGRVQQP
jgi:dethiobiotin synthetase